MIDTKNATKQLPTIQMSKKAATAVGAASSGPVSVKDVADGAKSDGGHQNGQQPDSQTTKSTRKRKKTTRKLRTRERRARYTEEFMTDSDSEDGESRKFDVEEKLHCERFSAENYDCVKELPGSEITLEYFQRHGFDTPILIKENSNNVLGMKMPPKTFSVDDVKQLVGPRRVLDVMNVQTQLADTMSMKDWCTYYNNADDRDRLLNVISLEFSHTKLETQVDSPRFVKQMDWVDLVWPRHLKKAQREGTNALHEMKYPKVQKYCLMSVKGCYTDFHIDFGGTSVWYHILRGGKVFWLIPPTERNIRLYEQWTLSGKQSDIFFGDTVEQCARVYLEAGNTFLIPTGWIHAVYTLEDSLVFGGNFLHSYGIEKQLRVSQVEDLTKVPHKFRYPFYTELLWYVLARYVHCLMGRNHLTVDDEGRCLLKPLVEPVNGTAEVKKEDGVVKTEIKDEPRENDSSTINTNQSQPNIANNNTGNNNQDPNNNPAPTGANVAKKDPYDTETEDEDEEEIERQLRQLQANNGNDPEKPKYKWPTCPFTSFRVTANTPKVHLSRFELEGLRTIVKWLGSLSASKRFTPELLISPQLLLKDAQKLLTAHEADEHERSITNKPVLFWLNRKLHQSLNANGKEHHPRSQSTQAKQSAVTALGGAQKRPKSPLNKSSGVGADSQYKVSSGTTLNLIPSSFEGLIAQTGLRTSGLVPGAFPFRSSSTSSNHSTTTTPVMVKPKPTKPLTIATNVPLVAPQPNSPLSPLVKPASPAYPPPPLPPPAQHNSTAPPPSNYNYGSPVNYDHGSGYYNNHGGPAQQQPQPQAISCPPGSRVEHAYNQPPALYHNPNMHHNYAYHPYRPTKPSYPMGGNPTTTSAAAPPYQASAPPMTRPTVVPTTFVSQHQQQHPARSPVVSSKAPSQLSTAPPTATTLQSVTVVRPLPSTPTTYQMVQPVVHTYQPQAQQQTYAQTPTMVNYNGFVNGGQNVAPTANYYQYYSQQPQQAQQHQIRVVQQQQQPQSAQQQPQQPTGVVTQHQQAVQSYPTAVVATPQVTTPTQLVYYHQSAAQVQPQPQQILVRPHQFIQTAAGPTAYSTVPTAYGAAQAYPTTTTQLYASAAPKPPTQPQPLYYVATPQATPLVATNTYPNQTYLMTTTTTNHQPTSQPSYPITTYHQPQSQSQAISHQQQQQQQQSQTQSLNTIQVNHHHQQQQQPAAVANISSFYPHYQPPPGGSSGAMYFSAATPTTRTYQIQYGR